PLPRSAARPARLRASGRRGGSQHRRRVDADAHHPARSVLAGARRAEAVPLLLRGAQRAPLLAVSTSQERAARLVLLLREGGEADRELRGPPAEPAATAARVRARL